MVSDEEDPVANHLSPAAPEHESLARPSRESSSPSADGGDVHPVLTLQRQVGNAQIQRMLAQRGPAKDEDDIQTKRDLSVIRREAADEDKDKEIDRKADPTLQRSGPVVGLEGGPVDNHLQGRIESQRSGGAPLDGKSRETMEHSFGESFDGVRIHHNDESDSLNRSLGAKAFTTGSDIFFRRDTSPADHGLLGHELTHVVQQRSGAVHSGAGMHVGPANDSFEQAADTAGATVASGGIVAQPQRETE